MNWSRGLFRLWIVAAAAWCVVITVVTFDDVIVPTWRVSTAKDGIVEVELYYRDVDLNTHRIDDFPVNLFETYGENVDRYYRILEERGHDTVADTEKNIENFLKINRLISAFDGRFIAVAILAVALFAPPLTLLLIGYVLRWIGRGFGKR